MDYIRIDPNYDISLMASAGTGKTYNLALRAVITLLKSKGMRINDESATIKKSVSSSSGRVLCLTFTRKATAEMYDRIDELLHRLYDKSVIDLPEFQEITNITGLGIEELHEISGRVLDSLSIDPEILQIKTIDSFFNMILSLFSFEANINPNFSIIERVDEIDYFNKAFHNVFISLSNDSRYFELLSGYIREIRLKPYDFINTLKSNLTLMSSDSIILTSEIKQYEQISIEDLCVLFDDVQEHATKIRNSISEMMRIVYLDESYCSKRFLNYKDDFIKVVEGGEIVGISEKFHYFSPGKVYLKKFSEYLDKTYETLYENLEELTKHYLDVLHKLDKAILIHIYKIFEGYFKSIKNDNKVFSYSDITKAVYSLLNPGSDLDLESIKNYIYFRLDGRIEHILVDEFQDTSLVQWYILKPLIDEAMSGLTQYGKVGSFFCVGDPKQNIYRFRGSNPAFFGAVNKIYSNKLKVETLLVNYRSDRHIVEFVNDVFNDAEIKTDELFSDDNKISHKFRNMHMFEGLSQGVHSLDDGYLKVVSINTEAKDIQGARVFNLIESVTQLKESGYKEIAVLVRKRSDGRYAKNQLIRNNIPAYTTFSENLYTRNAYVIIRSLVSYMISADKYSLLSFLVASPSIIPREDLINDDIFENLKSKLDASLEKSVGVPVYKRILLLDHEFSLLDRLNNDKDFYVAMNIMASSLFDHVNPSLFLSKLDSIAKSIKTEAFGDGVKISTVHSSKGLQFESVILFNVSQSFRLRQGDYFISEYISDDAQVEVTLNKSSASLPSLVEYEKMMKRYDCINMLYVACTRAKRALYLFVNKNAEKYSTDGYISSLYPSGLEKGELSVNNASEEILAISSDFISETDFSITTNLTPKDLPKVNALDKSITYESFLDRMFGTVLHKTIYYLTDYSDTDITRAVTKVRGRYSAYIDSSIFGNIKNYIELLVTSAFWKSLLIDSKIYRERAISLNGDVIVIDTYFVSNNNKQVIVVDFKTGDPDGERRDEYEEQVLSYQYALKSKYKCGVKAYLIYFHNGMSVVEIKK